MANLLENKSIELGNSIEESFESKEEAIAALRKLNQNWNKERHCLLLKETI